MEASDLDGAVRVWQAASIARGKRPSLQRVACENTGARRLYEALGMNPTRTRQVSETVEWVRYEMNL